MWLYSLLLITLFLYGSQAEEIDCSHGPVKPCILHEELQFSFPDTKESLLKMCAKAIRELECILNRANSCGLNDYGEVYDYKINLLKFICDTNLTVFHAMAQNLKCLKTVVTEYDYKTCHDLIISASEKMPKEDFQKIFNLYAIRNDTKEENDLRFCYNIAFDKACVVAHISQHCEIEAKETAQNVLSESNMLERLCKPKASVVVSDFSKILDVEADKM